jgi:GNAT superfamily N-acetyltransferase
MLEIREIEAEGPELETFREFLQEYQSYLGIDLCFQNFQKELANPLGRYTPPRGIVMLAHWNRDVAACGALQDLGEGNCELKRIYVRPAFRRKGIARSVSEYLMRRAEEIGYRAARLDTLKRLEGAGAVSLAGIQRDRALQHCSRARHRLYGAGARRARSITFSGEAG